MIANSRTVLGAQGRLATLRPGNPRYQKVIKVTIHHFVQHDLDALFIAANVPRRSAFNRVERKTAPLSRELSGLILPHDHYGSHLDKKGNTVDPQLQKKNFDFAGKALADVWSRLVLVGHPTAAEYIEPSASEPSEENVISKGQKWWETYVRPSQYFTQIVKCDNEKCCEKKRSSYFNVIKNRFLPPPLPIAQTSEGL